VFLSHQTNMSHQTHLSSFPSLSHSSSLLFSFSLFLSPSSTMWLRLVASIKSQVSFANVPYKRDDILQKRPIMLSMLLTVATPYLSHAISPPDISRILASELHANVYSCSFLTQCVHTHTQHHTHTYTHTHIQSYVCGFYQTFPGGKKMIKNDCA